MQTLPRLAVLVMCCGLTVCQTVSHYVLDQRLMSWSKAQEMCQRHYVDLAVLSTEEEYFSLCNATAGKKFSFWLGLQRQSVFSDWKWVSGEELSCEHWYIINYEGHCASMEATLETDKKLLARYCEEPHMVVCQGPMSLKEVAVDSVSSDRVHLSWNVSAFMQMTPHSYNVTACTNTCHTLLYSYINGSASMNVSLFNLSTATEYHIEISTFVFRPDSVTGGDAALQSQPTSLQVRTDHLEELDQVISPAELSTEETIIKMIHSTFREIGVSKGQS